MLLQTKLYMPKPHPALVARPHLTKRLAAGVPLTLICAPPGCGKSTLLAEWRAGQPALAVAWVSLDAGDNDSTRFWQYVLAALETVAPGSGEEARALLAVPGSPPEAAITALINAVAGLERPVVLVLDDYHVIDAPAIHGALAFLLDHLPPTLRLVIASRAEPPLPLARLRVRGQLTEFGPADLRFTPAEAAEFLGRVMGLPLTPAQVAELEARTEGWIAGLQLAALSMQGRADVAGLIGGFSGGHRFVFDYLAGEVLEQQPPAVQRFLLETAVLERLTGPLCAAVTGESAAGALLAGLERSNLFLVPLDDERRWYRYHHLFADFLRSRLASRAPAAEVAALRERAGGWLAAQGLAGEAIDQYLAAGAYDEAAVAIAIHSEVLLAGAEMVTLRAWLAALPDEHVRRSARLSLDYAWALVTAGHLGAVEERLRDAALAVKAGAAADADRLLGEVAAVRATVAAYVGDAPAAALLARQALERLPASAGFVRAAVALVLGGAHRVAGDLPAAAAAFTEARAISAAAGNRYVALLAICNVAGVEQAQGRLTAALLTIQDALASARTGGSMLPAAAVAYLSLAEILYERDDLAGAAAAAARGEELWRRWGNAEICMSGKAFQARLAWAQGDRAGARALLAMARGEVGPQELPGMTLELGAHTARLALLDGDLAAARQWAQGLELAADDQTLLHQATAALGVARVCLAGGDASAAAELLVRLERAADAAGQGLTLLEARILLALACEAQGDRAGALQYLAGAVALAEPEGCVRVFVDEGPALAPLLAAIPGAYAARLRAAVGVLTGAPASASASQPASAPVSASAQALVEQPTERELEVLRLVAAGHSNREIAGRLFLAEATVKRHIHNLYGKLGVVSRTQALVRARELGLM